MAEYIKDAANRVHVRDLSSSGSEYTLCGYAWDCDEYQMDGLPENPVPMYGHSGPSTCDDCKDIADKMRKTLKGVRFKLGN